MRWIVFACALVACGTPYVPPDDTDDTEGVDTDTDETGSDTDETGRWVKDTDTDTRPDDTADSAGPDTDDTNKDCLFGESKDCVGRCYPSYIIGDGTCDDGSVLPADFDCDLWFSDAGDCIDDTDTDTDGGNYCAYILEIAVPVLGFASEVGWELRDASNTLIASSRMGAYTKDNTSYLHRVVLADGAYKLVALDSWGDGWNDTVWRLLDATTGAVRHEGRDPGGDFTSYTHNFVAACGGVSCDMDVSVWVGDQPRELAWSLEAPAFPVASGTGASMAPNSTITKRVAVGDGVTYGVRVMDAGTNGWDDADRIEVRYPGGLLASAFHLNSGGTAFDSMRVSCDLANVGAFDAPGAPLELVSCSGVAFETALGTGAAQVSWTLFRASDWAVMAGTQVGLLADNTSDVRNANLTTGRYFLQTRDAGGDLWGAEWRVRAGAPIEPVFSTGHVGGYQSGRYLDVICPEVGETDETDSTDDTDLPPACLPSAILDCAGICWPERYVGDGVCDDGTNFAPDFACEDLAFDGGDCAAP